MQVLFVSFKRTVFCLDDCSLLQLLIYSEANANAVDDSGSTPLHYACLKGNEKAVRELLKVKDIDVKVYNKAFLINII